MVQLNALIDFDDDADFSEFVSRSISPNTIRKYQAEVRLARERGLDVENLTDHSIAKYLYSQFKRGLAYNSASMSRNALNWHWREKTGRNASGVLSQKTLEAYARNPEAQSREVGQASPITWIMCHAVCTRLDKSGTIENVRDAMMFSIMRDGLLRGSEIVALRIEDIKRLPDGTGVVRIRKSKTDQRARGHHRPLRKDTMKRIGRYLELSGLSDGWLVRRFHMNQWKPVLGTKPIHANQIRWLVKKHFKDYPGRLTAHSFRVGSAQELLARGYTIAQIARAGGWSSADTVLRYVQHLEAARSAMAEIDKL